MKKYSYIFLLLLPTSIHTEQKENSSKSPYSYYQKIKALKNQGQKLLCARSSYVATQALITSALIATSCKRPTLSGFLRSTAINTALYQCTK